MNLFTAMRTVSLIVLINLSSVGFSGDIDEVLQLLDAQQSLFESGITWDFEYSEVTLPQLKVDSVEEYAPVLKLRSETAFTIGHVDPSEIFAGSVRYDPEMSRFWFSASHVQKWIDGKSAYIATRESVSFDGEATWEVQTVKPGTVLPLEDFTHGADPEVDWFPNGTIKDEMPIHQRIQQLLTSSGYWFRPGYFAMPDSRQWGVSVGIAGFLRELKKSNTELQCEAIDEQRVLVSFGVPSPSGHSEDDGIIEIVFRLDQLAAVEQVAYKVSRLDALVASFSLKNQEVAPGIWFPSEITWGNWQNNRVIRTTIKNVSVVPAFCASDFQVQFPIGTRVADHRQKLNFVASNTPIDEDRAIREYAATYLGDFSALKRQPDNPERSRIRSVIAVLTSLVMISSVYLLWRHRRKHTAMITIFVLTSSWAVAEEEFVGNVKPASHSALKWSPTAGWILNSGEGGVEVGVSQCGFHVTELALAAFKRKCDPVLLSQHLCPTSSGICLAQITNVLQAFRINAEVRSRVSWSNLREELPEGVFAIIAIPPRHMAGGHYVGAFRKPSGGIMVLDAPYGAKALGNGAGKGYTEADLVVAYLTEMDAEPESIPGDIVAPEVIQLAADRTNWTNPVKATFQIENRGKLPQWLDPVKPLCGCVSVVSQPAMIEPGTRKDVELEIKPAYWGTGFRRKEVVLSFVGHNPISVILEGTLIAESAAEPNPANGIRIVRVPVACKGERLRNEVEIPVSALPADANVSVPLGRDWCVCEMNQHRDKLLASLDLTTEKLTSIRAGEVQRARVQLAGAALYHTFEIQVSQDCSQIHFEKRVFSVTGPEVEISGILDRDFDQDWRARVASSTLAVAEVPSSWQRGPDGRWTMSVQFQEPIQRPSPIRIQFYHPSSLPIETSVVLLPGSK